ncbi:Protein of unknown function DUF820 [Microcystis aeruginosa NIES-2481]|nr:Protein of unknown function DUF820 [Microcystis aeruginosa NIES-2481]
MLSATETKYYTPEEYLALEETSEDKNEYRQGEIIPMVGATTNHNQICLNFCRNFPLNINRPLHNLIKSQYIGYNKTNSNSKKP